MIQAMTGDRIVLNFEGVEKVIRVIDRFMAFLAFQFENEKQVYKLGYEELEEMGARVLKGEK